MTSVLPCSSASRRTWVCGESGFALIISAPVQAEWRVEPLGGRLGAGEVGDPPLGAGEAGRRPRGPSSATRPASPASFERTAGASCQNRRHGGVDAHQPQVARAEQAGGPGACRSASRSCAATCPASSPSAGSTTGAARSGSRGSSTARSSSSSTATGSAPRSEGIENVPAAGGALLVSNHSGALPPDAAMIAKAIREEHPHPRPLNITVEHFFKGYPRLLDADPEDRLRAGPPGQRAPPAVRRGAARARLPRGPQGHREALQGPLPAAPLRPRRVRRGGHARAGADRARLRGRAPRRRRRCSPRWGC